MKKIIYLILGFLFTTSLVLADNSVYQFKSVDVINSNSLKISFDKPITSLDPNSQIKIFKDIEISKISKDNLDNKKITLDLKSPVEIGKNYNILGLFGIETSTNFSVGDKFTTKIKTGEANNIKNIIIKDSTKIELYFNKNLTGNDFEFKFLENTETSKIKAEDGKINLETAEKLISDINYMLMIISMIDGNGNEIKTGDSIYDFKTPNNLQESIIIKDAINLNSAIILPKQIVGIKKDNGTGNNSSGNLDSVALKAKITPQTGPEIWFFIIGTLLISIFYFSTKRLVFVKD